MSLEVAALGLVASERNSTFENFDTEKSEGRGNLTEGEDRSLMLCRDLHLCGAVFCYIQCLGNASCLSEQCWVFSAMIHVFNAKSVHSWGKGPYPEQLWSLY